MGDAYEDERGQEDANGPENGTGEPADDAGER